MLEDLKTGRNAALDGIRGWAAIAVVYFHAISGMNPPVFFTPPDTLYAKWETTVLTFLNGSTAVQLFFILSGCVLALSIERSARQDGWLRSSVSFAVKRVLRIYPATIVCVCALALSYWLLSFWLPQLFVLFPIAAIAKNLVLLDWQVHGATWTLNVEMFAMPLMLIVGLAAVAIGETAIYLFVAAAIAVHYGPTTYPGFFQSFNMIYFALGCLITTRLGKLAANFINVYAALGLTLFSQVLFKDNPIVDVWIVQAICGFLFVTNVYHNPNTSLAMFLARPLSQFLGAISFSLYLWNVIVLNVLVTLFHWLTTPVSDFPVEAGVAMGTVVVLITIPIAMASTRYIEKPFIALGRAITRHPKTTNLSPVSAMALGVGH